MANPRNLNEYKEQYPGNMQPDMSANMQGGDLSTIPINAPKPETIEAADVRADVIGKDEIRKAAGVLRKYKEGKANLEERVIAAEEWWKLNHWEQYRAKSRNPNDPRPTSAWMFNSIINKHADMMDNFPEPNVLPREKSDQTAAKMLSEILPVVLEKSHFEETYDSVGWDKLKSGTGIYGIFFNPRLMNGLGDIDIKPLDMLNIFWEPGIRDIQSSKNLFIVELVDNEILEQRYPNLKGKLTTSAIDISKYEYDDTVDTSDKSLVVDWYYKINYGHGDVLQYVKFVNDELLYASENQDQYKTTGYYQHGQYPVVFDVMFEEKGTPAGFGYVDIMKSPQEYIDKLDQAILKNSLIMARPRVIVKDSAGINEKEFTDIDKDIIHAAGSPNDDNMMWVQVQAIPSQYLDVKQTKIDELKETSGNRDFSQGSTTSGVTAASAIAALQEAGSKTSRDMNKASYRAYTQICNLTIELIRQFYDEPRTFRILGETGNTDFVDFSNSMIKQQAPTNEFGVEIAGRLPIFDIKVRPQKSSPFSRLSQNELAIQLFNLGVFNPQLADQAQALLDMMDFEGKQQVTEKVQQNGNLYQQVQMLQQQLMQMSQIVSSATGDTRLEQALAGKQNSQPIPEGQATGNLPKTDQYGNIDNMDNSRAAQARRQAAEGAEVK